jgi:hypothetical protein
MPGYWTKGSNADWMVDGDVLRYPKVVISQHFTFNQSETLIEAQSLIQLLNHHFH